ncbi:hypothetical protein IQ658_001355 [Salmonella enterica]|nr:hypothetical protein [Salmonella enterica subsp. enterica serovar 4,[5],12:i:-]EGL5264417.1 hypothetical protein [Salmonella enterica]VEA46812.1 Uncharacterised protein [Salmonella enterica subsp. arizonae]
MDKKFVDLCFTMSPNIPRDTALEIVALKQVLSTILAKMPTDKRESIIDDLSGVDTDIMRDIVENFKKIK